jgi:CO dehydrogenase maturation factor
VVLDNEAGLENLSRRIVQKVDFLVLLIDPSVCGFDTARRIQGLAGEMEVVYDKLAIVVNRLRRQELPASADELKAATGADVIIALPDDDVIHDMAETHGNMRRLPPGHSLFNPLDGILDLVK